MCQERKEVPALGVMEFVPLISPLPFYISFQDDWREQYGFEFNDKRWRKSRNDISSLVRN